jgi:hypothetical protein
MLILTVIILSLSVTVMYLSPADDAEKIKEFKSRIPVFSIIWKRFVLALILGLLYFISWTLIWEYLLH